MSEVLDSVFAPIELAIDIEGDLKAGIELHLSGSHAHFATLHMNQDGVIR